MLNWLEKWRRECPEKRALCFGGKTLTYGELAQRTESRAAMLKERGIGPGSVVALLGKNSPQWVVAACAVFWRGAILVPLPWRATEEELDERLRRAAPELLITDSSIDTNHSNLAVEPLDSGARETKTPCQAAPIVPEALSTILFTSGTTGEPKMVGLTMENHLASARSSRERIGVQGDDLWLCCLPLYHTGGLAIVLRSLIYGTALELVQKFDAAAVDDLIRTRPITLASFVPTMVYRLLEERDGERGYFDTDLRAVLVGGGPICGDELRRARRFGLPVAPTYGMTEAASQLATLEPDAPEELLDTVGRVLRGVELRIEGKDDSIEEGRGGMIWVRGPMVSDRYLEGFDRRCEDNLKSKSSDRFRDGWFCTGDYGTVDDEGFLKIHHRKSERIVSGGENVDPREVEALLRKMEGVRDAAVVGVDDPEWGQVVAAAITTEKAGSADDRDSPWIQSLEEQCRRRLAGYKVPRRWAVVDELPTTATGKIKRAEICNQWSASFCGGAKRENHFTRSEDVST